MAQSLTQTVIASNRLHVQSLWLEASAATYNVTTLMEPGQLGGFYEKNGNKYQLVKFDANTPTIAAGTPVIWSDKLNFAVTADYDFSGSGRNFVAGVALFAVTAGNYGFIQVRGVYPTVVTDGGNDGVIGDLFIYAAVDGQVDAIAAGTASTYVPLGICFGTEAASAVALDIIVPLNGD